MSEGKKYYCFCSSNCKYETMTKEQIIAAIEQAATGGLVVDPDAGFVTKIKEANAGNYVTFWVGTQAEYAAIETKATNCLYIFTDDTTKEDFERFAADIRRTAEEAVATANTAAAECSAAFANAEEANANASAAVETANTAATNAAAAVATANEATETANAAATDAASAVTKANNALANAGIKREFNLTALPSADKTSMSYAQNLAWFYIIEVTDKTGNTTLANRETMALDYYSLISGNTYKFACGATICGELSGTKVNVILLNPTSHNYRLTRFTGYL